jgi:regulator-associated protein of mTOR
MDAVLASTIDILEDVVKLPDWQEELAFTEPRHTAPITGLQLADGNWRLKERVRTVSVALVLCLNVGVDPPDVVKIEPAAHLECWFDPLSEEPQKAIEHISVQLEKQYEQWHSRARYKKCLDPTVEEVKRLCTSLRRYSKEDRVLFHYNGHGVPRPTQNGEIWVFNEKYTQYIPLAIYDLQQWMGAPSIYVFDCSCAGSIVDSFLEFAKQNYENCFHLAACEAHQILPMQPDLPADLFTSCLTTPIKIALRWFIQKNNSGLIPKVTLDLVDKIPGSLSDRRTMLGELNWIFTAITDTIAWDVLPRDLFQRLYRQDLLVASLFRNFLLADRIMRTYDCTPVSHPKLPKTYHHPMWRAWDMVVDLCLSQLLDVLEERAPFRTSTFFAEQLTAFEVWLDMDHSAEQQPDHQLLPIILQVLLSPVHRLRALDLLSRFLNLGPGAVNSALSVGIFPYVLKLLQSNAREVRPFLLSIWAKILAIDRRCQVDLVRDHYHRYFLTILSDGSYDAHYRTMAAFVLTCIVRDYPLGQEVAFQSNLIASCLEQLDDPDPMLRKWLAICLGCSWDNYEDARWCGVRSCAHEKLYTILDDADPEVRAASVYALGTFINSSSERTDHANTIDHSIGMKLVTSSLYDSSVLVRHELVVSLQYLVIAFESHFMKLEQAAREEEHKQNGSAEPPFQPVTLGGTPPSLGSNRSAHASGFLSPTIQVNRSASKNVTRSQESSSNQVHHHQAAANLALSNHIPRVNSLNAIPLLFGASSKIVSNVYHVIWKAMYTLAADPHPRVSSAAQIVIDEIRSRSYQGMSSESLKESKSNSSISESSSPNTATFSISESPPSIAATKQQQPCDTTIKQQHQSPQQHQQQSQPQTQAQQHQQQNFSPSTAQATNIPMPTTAATTTNTTPNNSEHSISKPQQVPTTNIKRITKSADVAIDRPKNRYASSRENNASEDDNKSNVSSPRPLISTEFVDWCTKYFVDPDNSYTSARYSNTKEDQQREWRMLRVLSYRNVCLRELMIIDPARFNETVSNYKIQQVPNLVAVHPYDPIMIVAGKDEFSVLHSNGPHVNNYDYNSGLISSISSSAHISQTNCNAIIGNSAVMNSSTLAGSNHHLGNNLVNTSHHHNLMNGNGNSSGPHHQDVQHHGAHDLIGTQSNCHSSSSHITSLQLINPQYNTLVCTGSSDGSVRIWRAYNGIDYGFNPQLVTAFHLMPELQPHRTGLGMILSWDQNQNRFYATSDQNDVRIIKVWDAASESKIQDLPTCAEYGVSCLSSDGEHSIAAGFLDGSIRIYDTRLKKTDCRTFTFRKHSEKILALHMFKPGEKHINLVSGDSGGEVRFWDKRVPTSVKRVDVGQKMSVMSVHPNADVFAW